jgi:glutathione S-transferase
MEHLATLATDAKSISRASSPPRFDAVTGPSDEPRARASVSIRRLERIDFMIKLFGHPGSTCTRKVLMTLAETKTPFELVTIDFATREHKKEPHLSRQPFGQIPVIDDDGFMFYESRAICRYVNEKYGGALAPADVKGRALMEQWISIEVQNFSPHAMKFVYHHIFQRKQEDAVLENATKGLELALGVMEAELTKKPYLAGPDFTLADVVFMPYLEYDMMTPAKDIIAKYPHVIAWWNKLSERPTWQKVLGRS